MNIGQCNLCCFYGLNAPKLKKQRRVLESKADSCRAWSPSQQRSVFSLEQAAHEERLWLQQCRKRYFNKLTFLGRMSKLKVLISCL